jgi:transcriptional regulator with XRE-family HTH domain
MTFAEMIKNGREKLGITLAVACEHFGISISYLSDYENGRATKPKMEFIYKAAELYGLNVDDLCISANRIPKDIFFKIANNPKIFSIIRNIEV